MSANPQNVPPELTGSEPTDRRPGRERTGQIAGFSAFTSSSAPISYAPGHEALQALLAFSSLHEKIRERRARERLGLQAGTADVWELEQFVLDEVLQLVSERALTLTGADGVAIALVDGDAFVCRASAGSIAPEAGTRLDPKSGFSGACLRTGGIVRCDDSENDARVNVLVCRSLGTRSIVAIPIASSHGTIGLLEAFSGEAYGFNDSDVRSLNLLAELILAALKPEEENRMAEVSQRLVAGEGASSRFSDAGIHDVARFSESNPPAVQESGPDDSAGNGPTTGGSSATDASSPESAISQVPERGHKFKPRVGLIIAVLLLALAVLGAGIWWKSHPQMSVSSPGAAAPTSVAEPVQQAAPSAPNVGVSPPSSTDAKRPLQQLVTGIWNVSSPDSSTVIIDLQGEVQYEAHRLSDPERIYFDLHGTSLAHGLFGKTIEVGDPMLARVRIAQPRKGVSRIVLETNGASNFSVSLQSNPYRLVVEIRKAFKTDSGAVSPLADAERREAARTSADSPAKGFHDRDIESRNLQNQEFGVGMTSQPASIPAVPGRAGGKSERPQQIRLPKFRLVLDPGHGGWDLGTVGRKGLMEKDLVLDIVGRLGKLIQRRLGAEVIFTRQDDTYLPLEKRTEIANLAQADMFVSVHANYSEDSSARGAETYYTNTYSSVRARTADANSAVAENINWNDVDIREKVQQSRRFAVAVQQAMHRALAAQIPGMRNRGVKKASYVVLTGTSMPAILAEVSFVSSPADEDKLKSSNYRQNIAEGLYKGIAQYITTNHRVNLASASGKAKGL
jgi:N-acetylmuramoyl-L-alanine amidase